MKIKNLHIASHKHLQNLSFDFTYPEGHEKAGKPLDKICIIGQSATGKTSVLELIKDSFSHLDSLEILVGKYLFPHYQLPFDGELEFVLKDGACRLLSDKICFNEQQYINIKDGGGGSLTPLLSGKLKVLYLNSDLISKEAINIFSKNPLDILNDLKEKKNGISQGRINPSGYIYEFGQDLNIEIWLALLNDMLDYRKRFLQMASELINKGAIGDFTKLNKQFAKWAETNPNPLTLFAEYFNPILKKLNLEVDLINTEYLIPVKSLKKDEVIPISGLSTGTKGLLLSMFPLFELNTADSMILLDEPERSLFPDMQIDLISHYQNLAPEAQFIVATHSPFIAASFEPEERFILYFDEAGNVAVRRGESPIGDDPNDMLTNDFKIDYYNEFGKKAYQDYLNLKRRAAEETEPSKKKKLILELSELGDKYNF